ncbi:MAG: DNA recombination protein RmuC [Candidatus Nanopelagicales bacterium]
MDTTGLLPLLLAVALALLAAAAGGAVGMRLGRRSATAEAEPRLAALQATLEAERRAADERAAHARAEVARRDEVGALVAPVAGSLQALEDRVAAAERARLTAQAELAEQVRGLATGTEAVRREAGRLVTALGRSEVRGRWGEMQLRRLVEVSGLLAHVHFVEQDTRRSDDGAVRPDLVVHLADDKQVVVDAKVSLHAFLDAEAAEDEAGRTEALARHAAEVSSHVDRLASKEYWRAYEGTPEFVVLFLPAESLLGAALAQDPSLLDRAFSRGVVLATPTTLLALLRTVDHGWRQDAVARNAREIHELGRELHARLATMGGHLSRLGTALDGAVGQYNRTVASLEGRVLVSARRFTDLRVASEPLPEMAQVERVARRPQAPELGPEGADAVAVVATEEATGDAHPGATEDPLADQPADAEADAAVAEAAGWGASGAPRSDARAG